MAIREPEEVELASKVDEGLAHLRRLLERDEVEGARGFVKVLERRWPGNEHVQRLARVLAPPVARFYKGKPLRPLDPEVAWVRGNARNYPGCWLAISGDQLVASDPSLKVVLAKVRQVLGEEPPLLHWEPRPKSQP
jgi:hypothetical protein